MGGSTTAQLEHPTPEHSTLFSGFSGCLDTIRSRTLSRQWRDEAQTALLQVHLADLPHLLRELHFQGWFDLRSEFTIGDPIANFQRDLIGNPLTCYAGGAMRLKRPVVTDVGVANVDAFRRLNPWEMLKVGPNGLKPRPDKPSTEWWAKLNA